MKQSFRDMAQRIFNADAEFVDSVKEQFGFTDKQANKILTVYIKVKAVKLDPIGGRYNLTHGSFWEAEPMRRAIDLFTDA